MTVNYARMERQRLCETLSGVGPDAPTLCEGWAARDLAAHLVIRETRPDLAAGMLVGILAGRLDRAQRALAADWPAVVEQVRSGPPAWSPAGRSERVDRGMNTAEFYVHHEDVLRAATGWTTADARVLDTAQQEDLWSRMRMMAKLAFRHASVPVRLVAEQHGELDVGATDGTSPVVLSGRPSELLLYAFGRREVADVAAEGDQTALIQLRHARVGLV